jgi:hypothetical protein
MKVGAEARAGPEANPAAAARSAIAKIAKR